jgi:hypothetical protein
MAAYTFTDLVTGFLSFNCNTMNVYTSTTTTGVTLDYYIGGGAVTQSLSQIALDCALVDTGFITHSIVVDALNSNAVAMAAGIETIDIPNF